jgi:hypothetical protein
LRNLSALSLTLSKMMDIGDGSDIAQTNLD